MFRALHRSHVECRARMNAFIASAGIASRRVESQEMFQGVSNLYGRARITSRRHVRQDQVLSEMVSNIIYETLMM